MPINADPFRRVADAIENEPGHFDMGHYVMVKVGGGYDEDEEPTAENFCDTVMCIGGHAAFLSGFDAVDIADLSDSEMGALLGLSVRGVHPMFVALSDFWQDRLPLRDLRDSRRWDWMTEHPAEVAAVLRSIADGTIELHPDWVLS